MSLQKYLIKFVLLRVVIQELIKTVASSQQLNREGQKEFKVGSFFLLFV